ncbi:MAG TPA: hypothetical protein VJB13_03790 [Candidatus Nanoarchaeia archaeon]|nr:hypothetical protein [Candidatus Nanoarchaeia archaeon]
MLKIKSKKGLGMEFIITTSLLLISFFLIGGLLMRFTSKSSDAEAELLCQISIAQRAKTALNIDWSSGKEGLNLFKAQVKSIPPLCRTIDKKVSGSRDQILQQVADSTARCWWMFGEGKYEELLDNVKADFMPAILGYDEASPNKCFNCYTILVDQNDIKGGPITTDEINQYLSSHVYGRVNKTYLDYIQGYGGPGRIVSTAAEILPREAYAISIMPKNKKESTFWKGFIQQQIGLLLPGAGFPLFYIGQQNQIADLIKERDVSSIYLSSLQDGQERCS